MQAEIKLERGRLPWSLKAISLLLLGICALASGCRRGQTIWSGEARSPDGKMVATASMSANGGFGVSGAPATFVYLNWTTGSQTPTEILSVGNQSDRADEGQVGMKWLSQNRLELTYTGKHQNIEFQAVKFDGVEISVRDISIPTSPGNTP
jgi:hypothetical protein